jgi:Fic family protein
MPGDQKNQINGLKLLPPAIDYEPLIRIVGEAHGALGELNGLLRKNILNPALLSTPLLTKEAVLSSRIEGTQSTLEDVFEYEAQPKAGESSAQVREVIEIINYRRAINYAVDHMSSRAINRELVKKLQYLLLDPARGLKERGQFRTNKVYIGAIGTPIEEASYVPPDAAELPGLLENWEKYLNSNIEKDPLVQIGVAHYQFEAIHPFRDLNGRVGRLLIPLFLYQRQFLSSPLLFISEYFEKDRRTYYDCLRGVTERGDWTAWLKFFLLAIITQSLKTQTAIEKILEARERLKIKITAANSVYAAGLLDYLFSSPVVSYASLKNKLKTKNPQTIYNLIEKFVKLGILFEEPGRQRNRVFVFKELLNILK